MVMDWVEMFGIASIPAICLTAFINLQFKKLEKRMDERENARIERDYLLVKGTLASIDLGTAQARELQKDGKVNGNTASALEYAVEQKHKIEDFYTHHGVENLK